MALLIKQKFASSLYGVFPVPVVNSFRWRIRGEPLGPYDQKRFGRAE